MTAYGTVEYAGSYAVITTGTVTQFGTVAMNAVATMTVTAVGTAAFPFGARLGPILIGRS